MEQDFDIPERVTKLEAMSEAHERRIESHGHDIDELKLSTAKYHASTDEKLSRIDATVSRIDHRLEAEEKRPAETAREFVKQVIGYVLAAVVALVLARLGLK